MRVLVVRFVREPKRREGVGLNTDIHIRRLDASATEEVERIAAHMSRTLIEVLGEAQGDAMYTAGVAVQSCTTVR